LVLTDSDPKHTSNETRLFMLLNGINNYPMPPESPDLSPIEMVWNYIKYYLYNQKYDFNDKFNLFLINKLVSI
jgi:transposase